jgi:integrase/recombinase XerD
MKFKDWMKRRGKSPQTIEAYEYSIAKYLDHCGGKPSQETVKTFVDGFINRNAAPASTSRHYHAVRTYFRFLGREQELRDVFLPPVRNKEPRCIPREHLAKLLEHARMPTDRAIITSLYGCALRVSELLSLTMEDITCSPGYVRLRGSKDRGPDEADYIPIDASVVQGIKRHAQTAGIEAGRLFPYKYDAIRKRLQRLCIAADLPYYNPHSFRHGRLSELAVVHVVDIYRLGQFGRHKSIQTTRRYVHVKPEQLKKDIPGAFGGG